MKRLPKPDFLVQYEQWMNAGPPKCCHTCDHFAGDGKCFAFNMYPPADFVNSQGKCAAWSWGLPF